MFRQLKNRNFYFMVLGDMVLFALAFVGAYFVRFDLSLVGDILRQSLGVLPFVVLVKTATFFAFGLYRGMWRYSSLSDAWRLLRATILSSLVIICGILFVHHFHGYSRGVFVIDAGLTFCFAGALRIAIRLLYHHGFLQKTDHIDTASWSRPDTKRVMVIGAGDAGEMALREMLDNRGRENEVVGVVDNDPKKKRRLIHGVPVRGTIDDLPHLAEKLRARELVIAIPSATGPQMRRIVGICESCGVPYKTLPGLGQLIDGKVSVKALRDVHYEDLLGRKSVELEVESIDGDTRENRTHGQGSHQAFRKGARQGHRDHIYWIAARRKALRRADHGGGRHRQNSPRKNNGSSFGW